MPLSLANLFAYHADEAIRTVLTLKDQKDRKRRLRLAQKWMQAAHSLQAIESRGRLTAVVYDFGAAKARLRFSPKSDTGKTAVNPDDPFSDKGTIQPHGSILT
jgi:hypothetical protein